MDSEFHNNKKNERSDENGSVGEANQGPSADPNRQNLAESPPPQMFKLNIDCFENLFEYMTLKDLLAFRRTCIRMKQAVDYYIKLNYTRLLSLEYTHWISLDAFTESRRNFLDYIKELHIFMYDLKCTDTANIKYLLNRLELVTLKCVGIDGDFFENFLQFCSNLKYLKISTTLGNGPIIGNGNEWMLREYKKLEHFELIADDISSDTENDVQQKKFHCPELMTFYTQNPNIRIFSTNSSLLSAIQPSLLKWNRKLDRLVVRLDQTNWNLIHVDGHGVECANILNALHEQGFYNRLHICCSSDSEHLPYLASLRAVEKLALRTIFTLREVNDIPVMESLRQLSVDHCEIIPIEWIQTMARNFINIERIYMRRGSITRILPFIRVARKLKALIVKILYTDDTTNDEPSFKDFITLNNERKLLDDARKVTIYIDEKTFLKLKWTSKVDFGFIKLMRFDSCPPEHFFDY